MPIVYITKRVNFNAAHRLYSKTYSDEKNESVFGKCNNPNGHGHNYILDVTLKGEVDPVTGMVANLTTIKEDVNRLIVDVFDHKHLNLDVAYFADLNPTAENIAVVCWKILSDTDYGHLLHKVVIHETPTNSAEYRGE
ncbi:6-carboxy-5,6,7,8-tetrahydropterin synthase [BD1-7 clade bacterium]|uniref:6-carboxy-5,6,7,8-tetrahydropterin synthase n=1 Tax=BD1-7 clade bacterium TaxID=2029982 RepID=A0A5S9QTF6_9GAMM|nr:6-carboxy-5,6,7,8-tetrahydropterin synthase [BD1-7 clade bacterium]CAA0122791.1 6-carboxy-5,6,7,8-tetrahydropterin synthase [BD1-7 clade bacterium]